MREPSDSAIPTQPAIKNRGQKGSVRPNNQSSPGPIGNTQGIIVPVTSPNASDANSAPPPQPAPKEEGWWGSWGSAATHIGLDVIGLIPVVGEVADGANALIYVAEGDYVNAAISAAAMIPIAGNAVTGAKLAVKATKLAGKGTELAVTAGKSVAKVVAKTGESAVKVGKSAAKIVAKTAKSAANKSKAAFKKAKWKLSKKAKKAAKGGHVKGPKKNTNKAEQLKKNKARGKQRELEVKKELEAEGHEVLGSEVTIKTSKTNRRVDHLIRDGKTGQIRAIEVKSGGATRNSTQISKDTAMASDGGKIIGKNAPPELEGKTEKIPTEVRN